MVTLFQERMERLKRILFPPTCGLGEKPVISNPGEVVPEPVPQKDYSWFCVCLDNGHGNNTPGKRSPYAADEKNLPPLFLREYEWTREMTRLLRDRLEALGVNVFMTTPEDYDVSLTSRYKRANIFKQEHPDLKCVLLSVHNDASGDGSAWMKANGWSVWTTEGVNNSDKLASFLYDAAEEIFPEDKKIRKYKLTGTERDFEKNYTIIYGANMPAVLTENFFQDNIEDVEYLLSDKGMDDIINVHIKGLLDYADSIRT